MKILSWNCRGLGNPQTIQELCRLVKEKKPEVVFLMETKLNNKKLEPIRVKLGFQMPLGLIVSERAEAWLFFVKVLQGWKSKIAV
jgi:hypothetical protein